jgi:hypothetical protein
MKMFHQHPEDLIFVRTDAQTYHGTSEQFVAEFGEVLPSLPVGVLERIYEPGRRHALMDREHVLGGGPMPWDFGDRAIAAIGKLCAAQERRESISESISN